MHVTCVISDKWYVILHIHIPFIRYLSDITHTHTIYQILHMHITCMCTCDIYLYHMHVIFIYITCISHACVHVYIYISHACVHVILHMCITYICELVNGMCESIPQTYVTNVCVIYMCSHKSMFF